MQRSFYRTAVTTILCLVCSSCIGLQASLLDTPSPYWSQNHPLGRNPARAAYLREQNRLNLSYTLGTQVTYTDNYYDSINGHFDYYKEISSEAPNPYTNTYFSSAVPLGSQGLYVSLLYNNYTYSRRNSWVPSKNVSAPDKVDVHYFDDANLSHVGQGLSFSFPLLNKGIFVGFESLVHKESYEHYDQTNEYTSIGGVVENYQYNGTAFYESDPYYSYSIGLIFPFQTLLTLDMSHTVFTPRFTVVNYRYRDNITPAWNEDLEGVDQYYDYLPPVTGLGLTFLGIKGIELGLSTEFIGNGTMYDSSVRGWGNQNYIITKAFTRYALAIECKPARSFTFRSFGSVTPAKDARVSRYDWTLLTDKRSYAPADEGGDFDVQNVFNEEEFGIDLEFTAAEKYSAIIGAGKKNYIFAGNRPPYGIALAVEDIRAYLGFSIIGVFEGDEKRPEQEKSKPVSAKYEKIPTADKKLPDRDTENSITPKEGTPNAYTTFQEEVYVSAQNVFPGDNIIVTVKEGKAPLFKATVGYIVKKQEYRYPLYQDDAEKTWKATVPVSPLTPPGTYALKINKIYDDTSLEVSTFPVTVKALPKDQQ